MPKLKKAEFDKRCRFREARQNNPREGLVNRVNCSSCTNMSGGANNEELALCNHSERFRKVKIMAYWSGWGNRTGNYIASQCVCDAYTPHPLPKEINLPILPEHHAILLGSQYADPYHTDSNCPYVIEEARMLTINNGDTGTLRRAEIYVCDISDKVPGETIRDICDMPCCETKLPFQLLYNPNGYRARVGLKPDGSEPRVWVRNGIVKHERNVEMTIEEAEVVFDLSRFSTLDKNLHLRITSVSDYLRKHCNRLGSRPLSEAVNPVHLGSSYHILDDPILVSNSGADVWVYDERLFDRKRIVLSKLLKDLEKIPEGIIPCMDVHKVFRNARSYCGDYESSGTYHFFGLLKPASPNLASRGVNHLIEINAVKFHGYEHMWGEFGRGFNGLASFHEE